MKLISTMVIDDEAPARRKICRFLASESDIEVVDVSAGGVEAVETIRRKTPDLLFLDVQMPGMDGFEIVEALDVKLMPSIIFVTAHDNYALRAFEVHALDYLLKPFDIKRFQKVLDRARLRLRQVSNTRRDDGINELLKELRATENRPSRLLIRANERAFFLPVEQINWVESSGNYVNIHAGSDVYLLRGTITGLQKQLDPAKFIRVNRSNIINLEAVKEMQPWFHGEYRIILTDGTEIMWSRRYLDRSSDAFIGRF